MNILTVNLAAWRDLRSRYRGIVLAPHINLEGGKDTPGAVPTHDRFGPAQCCSALSSSASRPGSEATSWARRSIVRPGRPEIGPPWAVCAMFRVRRTEQTTTIGSLSAASLAPFRHGQRTLSQSMPANLSWCL
jgi:hypothetical protein